jgi:hypothetical protein
MWIAESSLEAKRILPERETPTLVKLELGVGGVYCASSWSPRTSHRRTWAQHHTAVS